jgi:hypothetical protein
MFFSELFPFIFDKQYQYNKALSYDYLSFLWQIIFYTTTKNIVVVLCYGAVAGCI